MQMAGADALQQSKYGDHVGGKTPFLKNLNKQSLQVVPDIRPQEFRSQYLILARPVSE